MTVTAEGQRLGPAPTGSGSRRTRVRARLRAPRIRPYLVGEAVVIVVLLRVYDLVKNLAANKKGAALHHGVDLVDAERAVHAFWEPGLNAFVTRHHWLSLLTSYYYNFEFYTVAFIVLIVCYVRWPERYRPARNALVLTNVVGLLVFFLYPVTPPRLLGPPFSFHDSVAAAGFGVSHGAPVPANAYAAMPSLHCAWALWVAFVILASSRRRWLGALAFLYPLATGYAVMATANHYLLDAVAGVATTLLCLGVALGWERYCGRRLVLAR